MAEKEHLYAAVRSTLMASILNRLIARGASPKSLLAKYRLKPDTLTDPYTHLPMNEYIAFLENAAKLSGDSDLGARLGADIRASDLGPVGILLSLSRSIYVGIDRIKSSSGALQTGSEFAFLPNGSEMLVSYQLSDPQIWPRRQDAEFTLVALVKVIRDNFLSRWTPEQVHFEHTKPEDDAFVRSFFQCQILYGQATNRLVIERAPLLENYRAEDDALVSMLQQHIIDLVRAEPVQRTLTDAVRNIISSSLGSRPVSVPRIAETLGITRSKLQRKLSEEQTSVRDLLDDIRRDRATMLLSDGQTPVGEVAAALGYADGTAFWRAHKRWSKLTPREVKSGKGYR